MRDFLIISDSATDLSAEMAQKLGVKSISMEVVLDGGEPILGDKLDTKAFYTELRAKKNATTSAINLDRFISFFESFLQEDVDLLYLGFSSGLSGTFQAATLAMQEIGRASCRERV